jgi:general stress protein 26
MGTARLRPSACRRPEAATLAEPRLQAPASAGVQAELSNVLELIRHIRIALLTTLERDGAFHARPVQTLGIDADGTLWFFTDLHSGKAHELRADMRVSLGYANTATNRYVAVNGVGTVLRDPHRAQELWQVEQRAYYPTGPGDERLGLLRVQIERDEYWIAPGRPSYLYAALKAAATGTPAGVIGVNAEVRPRGRHPR